MHHQGSFPINDLTPLQKGKACQNCRRRKVKCDAVKPICFQCSRYPTAFSDCEYTEDGPSLSETLEEQISLLRARIEELERPGFRQQSTSTSQITSSNTLALGPYFHLQHASGTALNTANSTPTEPPFIVLQALAHNFIHIAPRCGFFLDPQTFHDAITAIDGPDLPPVLLNVMYLWGIHLSEDPRIMGYEPAFLAHALRSTAGSLSGTHPRRILHSIQASVLLAYYFLRHSRFLEAKFHITAAVSVALSTGLHRIRAPHGSDCDSADVRVVSDMVAPTKDMREEGERIGAFWSVLHVHNRFASNSSYGYVPTALTIDTPWPLDIADYVERPHLLPQQSSGTVAKFLWDVPDEATSSAALYAKAGILYEEATRLGGRCRSGNLSPNDPQFTALDRKIDAFTPTLPSIQSQRMLVVHTLAHCATIQLHDPLVNTCVGSRTSTLIAARAVVDIIVQTDIPRLGLIDPVIAPLWTATALALISEINHQHHEDRKSTTAEELKDCVNTIIATMGLSAPFCHLMAAQLEAVRRAYKGVQGDRDPNGIRP
ncbi:hypothetical protein B0H14DRAFT_3866027 [Mycena olivaceomarginata]|nr:hypothetical protein B0H14DRAFT_3866027 [Mycena olivaceomarginata]